MTCYHFEFGLEEKVEITHLVTMAMQFLQVMKRKCVLPVKLYENSSISATRMSFLFLFWIFQLNNLNNYYITSENCCLADLGFVAKKIIALCGIIYPTHQCKYRLLVAFKNEEDPVKNEGARLVTTLFIIFSDAQGQLTPKSVMESC